VCVTVSDVIWSVFW